MELATYTFQSGATYNYVENTRFDQVEPYTIVDFGLVDKKGRAIGMNRSVSRREVTLRKTAPQNGFGTMHEVGRPLVEFVGRAQQTRNTAPYGGASVVVYAETAEACIAELDARIERARKAAQRKWGVK